MSRRAIIAICVAAAAIVLGFTFLRPSDEDRIRKTLARLAKAVAVKPDDNVISRAGRIRSEFAETVTDDVSASVVGLNVRARGRKELADSATKAQGMFSSATCELTDLTIKIDETRTTASVDGTALVTADRGGERKVDKRDVHFLLRNDDGWKVTTIDVFEDRESSGGR